MPQMSCHKQLYVCIAQGAFFVFIVHTSGGWYVGGGIHWHVEYDQNARSRVHAEGGWDSPLQNLMLSISYHDIDGNVCICMIVFIVNKM